MCNKNKTAVTNFGALLNFVLLLLNLLHVTPVTFCKLYKLGFGLRYMLGYVLTYMCLCV